MAATRFYLPDSGAPPITPAIDAGWTLNTAPVRRPMPTTKQNTALANNFTSQTNVSGELFWRQYVSSLGLSVAGAAAISLAGSVGTLLAQIQSIVQGANGFPDISIRVISPGGVVRGTLIALKGAAAIDQFSTVAYTNHCYPGLVTPGTPTNLTAVPSAQPGDYIVVEFGAWLPNVGSPTCGWRLGDPTGSTDFGTDDTDTSTTKASWVQLSADLFAASGPTLISRVDTQTGNAGSASTNSFGNTLAITTTRTINIGEKIFIDCGSNNAFGLITGISDGGIGNTFAKVLEADQGSANAHVEMWYSDITAQIPAGSTITVTWTSAQGGGRAAQIVGYTGVKVGAPEQTASNGGFASSQPSGTTAANSSTRSLVRAIYCEQSLGTTLTSVAGFVLGSVVVPGGFGYGVSEAYKTAFAAGTQSAPAIASSGDTWADVIAVFGEAPPAVQLAVPYRDNLTGGWTPTPASPATFFDKIDEAASPDDADFITSSPSPSSPDISRVKLNAINPPGVTTGHHVRIRYRKNTTGGDTINLTVRLMQRDKTNNTFSEVFNKVYNNVDAITTDDITMTGGQVSAITDYGELYLQFEALRV